MEVVKIFDAKFQNLVQSEPRIIEYVEDTEVVKAEIQPFSDDSPVDANQTDEKLEEKTTFTCSFCKIQFDNVEKHRNHYKLDWHRYNLQRNLNGQPPVTENEFEEKEEVSSISGSESESETLSETKSSTYLGQNQGKIYIKSSHGQILLMHRCLLADKKQEIIDLKQSLYKLKNTKWCVLMLGGGHFAGAIFDGSTPILHKTFHCYTVRQGQGGSQSAKDNKGGSAPKSAGASLRRYNEQALVQHVTSILETWKDEIAKCSLIPFRAPGPYNKNVLFGGKTPILRRADERLRVIPFATRRATFNEVKRVQEVLATVNVYDSIESIPKHIITPDEKAERKRNKAKAGAINRAKSRESVERPLPCPFEDESTNHEPSTNNLDVANEDSASQNGDDCEHSMESLEISFTESLQSFGDSLTAAERRRQGKKPKSTEKSRQHLENQAKIKEEKARLKAETELKSSFMQAFMSNNEFALEALLEQQPTLVSLRINPAEDTALHLCAEAKKSAFIELLLAHGADVCAKNAENQTPYTMTQDKSIRELFKKFASDNPDKFNYSKAQIPVTQKLSEEQLEEKKLRLKDQKKAKRERHKENKKTKLVEKQEEDERDRFAQLSDREKRALAAERRILDSKGLVISRCFLCGGDMSGKVPFEYSGNRFCSIDCLKAHRMKNPVLLS